MRKWTALVLVTVVLVACGDKLDRQGRWIERFFALGKTGSGTDYFLVQNGLAGPNKVGVIYGFVDDFGFCSEIAELYMKRHAASSYYCVPAN